MKLRLVWLGKTRDPHLASLAKDFAARIEHTLPIEITELKDVKTGDGERRLQDEASRILGTLDGSDRVILLDASGPMWSSNQLAEFLGKHMNEEQRRLTFVIGGFGGTAESVRKRADRKWSLSPLTFTHDMTRVLVLEQLYRALAILNNHPYSK
jgi:23S rRNA (pseudouridine1915-N3)-methyltransferase